MTSRTILFCDSCLEDLPLEATEPGELWPPAIKLTMTGAVGLNFQGDSVKHFHNAECLSRFLEEARPREASE